MSTVKVISNYLLLAALETNGYGNGATVSPTVNTVLCAGGDAPDATIAYSYDGDRKGMALSGGNQRRTTPSGKSITTKIDMDLKGNGIGYNTSVSGSPPVHNFLLASGFSGSLSAGAWTYTYTPITTAPNSLALQLYSRIAGGSGAEVYPISGSYGKMSFKADTNGGPLVMSFALSGIPGTPTDAVAVPTNITWNASSVIPPKGEKLSFTAGSFVANLRDVSYDDGLDIGPRVNLSATGSFSGYYIGRRSPKLTVTIEDDAFSSYSPLADWDSAVQRSVSFTVGSGLTANSCTMTFPSASIGSVKPDKSGDIATWVIEYYPTPSSPSANDDVILTFNA
ncbi:MAG TPA: hypothetical protein VGM77_11150 [Gemmatimonadales bacterium]|jgi:hypothetical protein